MVRPPQPRQHLIGDRVASAKNKTQKVLGDIHLAEAELHLANLVITDKLAESVTDAELSRVALHNETVEEKLRDAGEELKVVTDLLTCEERDRKKLEQTLAQHRNVDGSSAGARSGAGSASVIEHLRELTRHKVSDDHAEPSRRDVPPARPVGQSAPTK